MVQPGSGGLQGDVSMPSQFAAIYDPKIADWIAQKNALLDSALEAYDPLTGRLIDVGTTVYADDAGETNLTKDEEHRLEVNRISSETMDEVLDELGSVSYTHLTLPTNREV